MSELPTEDTNLPLDAPTKRALAIQDAAHKVTARADGDALVVNTYQDVEPHLDYAAACCRRVDAEDRGHFGKRGDMRRTMSVPFNVIAAVCQRLGIEPRHAFDKEYAARIWAELKGPEFKAFRTTIDAKIG